MQEVKKLTVFLSCPGDVLEERQKAEQAIKSYSEQFNGDGIEFDVFHFGKAVSEFGAPAQEIINKQLPEFDI